MAGLAKVTKLLKAVNKRKKHGVKAGQKSLIRPSQKKAVKNGRHQEKEIPKAKIAKAVKAIPDGLDGEILDDTNYDLDLEVSEADFCDEDVFDEELQDNLESEVDE